MNNDFEAAIDFVKTNPAVVLGTVDENNKPYGAVVYACSLTPKSLHFLTKNGTRKFFNLLTKPTVSITAVDTQKGGTLQATGTAHVEEDAARCRLVMDKIAEIHARHATWLPPIAQLYAGAYEVVRIDLEETRVTHFDA